MCASTRSPILRTSSPRHRPAICWRSSPGARARARVGAGRQPSPHSHMQHTRGPRMPGRGARAAPGAASEAMMLAMSAGRVSASVRGVLVTTVFHTCSAAARTVYPTSLRAMYTRARICARHAAAQHRGPAPPGGIPDWHASAAPRCAAASPGPPRWRRRAPLWTRPRRRCRRRCAPCPTCPRPACGQDALCMRACAWLPRLASSEYRDLHACRSGVAALP